MSDQHTVSLKPIATRPRLALPLALLVLAALVFACVTVILMFGSSEGTIEMPASMAIADSDDVTTGTDDDPGAAPAEDGPAFASLTTTYEVFLARDPFDPVVPEPEAPEQGTPTAPTDPADPAAPVTPVEPGDPSVPGRPAPGDPAAEGCTGSTEVVCDGQVVTLVDIGTSLDGERIAVIQVGSVVYEARVGEVFAGTFQVRAIDGSCVSLLFGDDGFQLCKGDRVLK